MSGGGGEGTVEARRGETPTGPTFDVFISYSRANKDFAAALERRLERYRPPRGLDVPHRHLKVFRDEGDLTGTEYYASIERALAASSKMVLICSPRARASDFVNDEIRRFVELRGAEHVIPVLREGIPNNEATPETEEEQAFPQALLEAMELPLATPWLGFDPARDRVDHGRFEGSWYTLLANVLELSRDEVEQRTRKRTQRRRRIVAGSALTTMAALAALSVWALLERSAAREAQAVAESRLMATRALQPPRGDPLYALVHGLSALLRAGTFEAEGALLTVVEAPRVLELVHHGGGVHVAAPAPVPRTGGPPGSSRLLTVSEDGTARITDTLPGIDPVVLEGHRGSVGHGAWSPDGRRVVTGGADGTARIWDAATGRQLGELVHGSEVWRVAFTPDGSRLVTAAEGGAVRLWTADGDSVATLAGPAAIVRHLAVDPVRGRVATASGEIADPVRLWDPATGALERTLEAGPGWAAVDLAFSGNGNRLAAADAGSGVRIWEMEDGAPVSVIRPVEGMDVEASAQTLGIPPEQAVRLGSARIQVALDADGSRLALENRSSAEVELRSVEDGSRLARLVGHRAPVDGMAFGGGGGWLATWSEDGTARIWEVPTGHLLEDYGGHRRSVRDAAFYPGGRWLATASADGSARVWEVRRATRLAAVLEDRAGRLAGPATQGPWAYAPRGDRVATVRPGSGDVDVWGTSVGRNLLHLPTGGDRRFVTSAWDAGGERLAVAWTDGAVQVVDVEEGRTVGSFTLPGRPWSLRFRPGDGPPLVAAVLDSMVRLVEPSSGEVVREIPSVNLHDSVPVRVAIYMDPALFSPDGDRLAVVAGATVELRGGDDGSLIATLETEGPLVRHMAFSADGRRLVTATDGTARVWSAADGRPVSPPVTPPRGILTAALDPDGDSLVTSSDDFTATVWSVATGQALHTLEGHVTNVYTAGYSPDGTTVVTYAPAEATVRLWNAATGRPQAVFRGPPGDSTVGAWFGGPDGRLVLGSREGAARVLRTGRCPLLAHARTRLPVAFPDSAWERMLAGLPLPPEEVEECREEG